MYLYVFICSLDIWVPRPSIVIKILYIYIISHLFCGKVRAGTRYLIGQRSMHGAGASEVTRLVQVITTMRIELCEGLTTMYLIEQRQFGSSIFIENSS